ncbi:hypothetical protein L9F63_022181 [Diploptera punctata]|uniref:Uncharacterized protein n=1 Tax=Diploptera punctata TaxID=6984 RepID=A0AAD7ZMZ5_DIPPU|nr:hypothetical protein L9F63_022181 [Diploptera punctata]
MKQNGTLLFTDNLSGDIQQTLNNFLSNPQNLNQLLGSLTNAMQAGTGTTTMRQVIPNPAAFPFMAQPGPVLPTPPQSQAEQQWAMSVAPPPPSTRPSLR